MLKKIAGIYSLITGLSMAGVWIAYFATGTVFGIKPAASGTAMALHVAAEFVTAAVMGAAGAGLLAGWKRSKELYFLGLGMLVYAAVNSAGYYPGGGAFIAVMFGATFAAGVVFAVIGFYI